MSSIISVRTTVNGERRGRPGKLLRCFRALYGLKESGNLWQVKLTATLERLGFSAVPGVECVMTDGTIIIFFHVDDLGLAYHRRHAARVSTLKQDPAAALEIKELGPFDWFLGIKIILGPYSPPSPLLGLKNIADSTSSAPSRERVQRGHSSVRVRQDSRLQSFVERIFR